MPLPIAQSVVEYGLLEQMASGAQRASYAVRNFLYDAGPATWVVMIGGAACIVWFLVRRNR
jgi:hypothetical protein